MAGCPSCGTANPKSAKFCSECGAPLAAPAAREQRKVVTILFCDVTGSTKLGERLDPESLRRMLARYFERMKAIVERHGGTVEKFIGDAVMAVFGAPVLHEDDALRAVRAAVAMRIELRELNEELEHDYAITLEARIGVNTGEVVTGTAERLATGDAVNVAARLQQAAEPSEILLGGETLRLTHQSVEVEVVVPLSFKGKVQPVAAYRLVAVRAGDPEREPVAAMVGRKRELRRLRDTLAQAIADRSCQLFTILGAPGVGKSRLVYEFLLSLDDVTLVRGRCLSYGEGITYWPVVEVLKQLEPRLPELAPDPLVLAAVRGVLGDDHASSTHEIAWAFRKLLEAAAAQAPVVCVIDDLHWAEKTLFDLVEHVADLSRDAPILLLCIARPELFEQRPGWSGGKLNATTALLEPLGEEESKALIDALLGGKPIATTLRERIGVAAEGNPLFVEQMVALARESPTSEVVVPPTIHALLAARLDQLDVSERSVLERGAIEGRVFHRGAVEALAPEDPHVPTRLTALVRKELIRPDRPQLAGEEAYRFRHLLIRDAAYDGLPKAQRAELHERFAAWLEEHGREIVELDELLGYHLEQACRYRQELGPLDEEGEELAVRAAGRLRAAGRRALERGDVGVAVGLSERALRALPPTRLDAGLEVDRGYGLLLLGRGAEGAVVLAAAAERAVVAGDRLAELRIRAELTNIGSLLEPDGAVQRLRSLAAEAIPELEEAGDDAGLAIAWCANVIAEEADGRSCAAVAAAAGRLIEHAGRADDRISLNWAQSQMLFACVTGATPVAECVALLDAHRDLERRTLVTARPWLLAMLGRFDEANRWLRETRGRLEEFGVVHPLASLAKRRFDVAMLEGDAVSALEAASTARDLFDRAGDRANLAAVSCYLADALLRLGRLDEAEHRLTDGYGTDESRILARQTHGKLLALRGDLEAGERLAREAVVLAGETDMLNIHGGALLDLAEVLDRAGKPDEATTATEQAVALFERKGNLVMAARARSGLDAPLAATPQQ